MLLQKKHFEKLFASRLFTVLSLTKEANFLNSVMQKRSDHSVGTIVFLLNTLMERIGCEQQNEFSEYRVE